MHRLPGTVFEAKPSGNRAILNSSLLTTPDGMPAVWLGHWQGHKNMKRVLLPEREA